jgi:hypothetical protein
VALFLLFAVHFWPHFVFTTFLPFLFFTTRLTNMQALQRAAHHQQLRCAQVCVLGQVSFCFSAPRWQRFILTAAFREFPAEGPHASVASGHAQLIDV